MRQDDPDAECAEAAKAFEDFRDRVIAGQWDEAARRAVAEPGIRTTPGAWPSPSRRIRGLLARACNCAGVVRAKPVEDVVALTVRWGGAAGATTTLSARVVEGEWRIELPASEIGLCRLLSSVRGGLARRIASRVWRDPLGALVLALLVLGLTTATARILGFVWPGACEAASVVLTPLLMMLCLLIYAAIFYYLGRFVVGAVRKKGKTAHYPLEPRFNLMPAFFTSYVSTPCAVGILAAFGVHPEIGTSVALLTAYPLPFLLAGRDYLIRRKAYAKALADGSLDRWKPTMRKVRRIENATFVGKALLRLLTLALALGPPVAGLVILLRS